MLAKCFIYKIIIFLSLKSCYKLKTTFLFVQLTVQGPLPATCDLNYSAVLLKLFLKSKRKKKVQCLYSKMNFIITYIFLKLSLKCSYLNYCAHNVTKVCLLYINIRMTWVFSLETTFDPTS